MFTVMVSDKYAETLRALGDVQSAIDVAIQRYTIEQITARIHEMRRREAAYQEKYDLDYQSFVERSREDDDFAAQLEAQGYKTWENDLMDWGFCQQGIQDWTQRLQKILLE
jgi:hypothetical protein